MGGYKRLVLIKHRLRSVLTRMGGFANNTQNENGLTMIVLVLECHWRVV